MCTLEHRGVSEHRKGVAWRRPSTCTCHRQDRCAETRVHRHMCTHMCAQTHVYGLVVRSCMYAIVHAVVRVGAHVVAPSRVGFGHVGVHTIVRMVVHAMVHVIVHANIHMTVYAVVHEFVRAVVHEIVHTIV
jgi:hypothetical protein